MLLNLKVLRLVHSSKDLKKKGMKVGKNVFISNINIVGIKKYFNKGQC